LARQPPGSDARAPTALTSETPTEDGRSTDLVGRREFLAGAATVVAGAATAVGLAACGGSSRSQPTRRFASTASVQIDGHVQTFRSRADLRPPRVLMTKRPASPSNAVILTDCHAGPGQQGPMILDSSGRLIWWVPVSQRPTAASRAMNLRVQSYRGKPVITWWHGAIVEDYGEGHYTIVDQRYRRVAEVHGGNGYKGDLHEFVLTDSGTALFTAYGRSSAMLPHPDGSRHGNYVYGLVQEVDVASGRVLFQWRTDEHVGFIDSYHPAPDDPTVPWDYFHVNSIAIDPADGHLLISGRNVWAFYKVHRRTGEVIWTLGGKRSDFEVGRGAHFAFQHHVRPHSGGRITIFDNEAGPPREAKQSRGLVLAVDENAFTAKFVREFKHRPPVLSAALGSVEDLADSGGAGTFMGWGDSSYFTHYDPSGAVLLDGRLAGTSLSYRAFLQAWRGQPMTQPALAVQRASAGAHLYASWNGSAVHRTWRVLGGSGTERLQELGIADVADFETEITVPRAPDWLAVEALDAGGQTLARSRAVRA
jgi:hypothetical protein